MSDSLHMDVAIIPAAPGTEAYVELASSGSTHRFRKHILTLGPLIHPKTGETLNLDENWYSQLKENWNSKVCPIVQFPAADKDNRHSEDPLRNLGQVTNLSREGSKVYVDIDVPEADVAGKVGKTILGASAFMHLNYTDTRTGKKVGPALLHVAATNRPYVTDLDPYEEVVAATADIDWDEPVVMTSPEEPAVPTKEELLAALKAEHGIDVEAIQAAAAQKTDTAALTSAIVDALKDSGQVSLAADTSGDGSTELTQKDLVGAVVELAQSNKDQAESISRLQRREAEHEVDSYVTKGLVLPKQRAAFVELALTNRDMLDTLLPAEPVVQLNAQAGMDGPDGEQRHKEDIDAEVMRLTTEHARHGFEANGRGTRK